MASSAGPKLTKNVETNIGAHENAKANRTISRAGDAARLPCPRNEGRTGRTTNARKGERLVAIVMPCEQRAHNGVLGSPKETSLTGGEVAIVLMQRDGDTVLQRFRE